MLDSVFCRCIGERYLPNVFFISDKEKSESSIILQVFVMEWVIRNSSCAREISVSTHEDII